MKYPEALKQRIITKMLPPLNQSVAASSQETGIPYNTLYYWRIKALKRGRVDNLSQSSLSAEQKLNIIIETATLSQAELGAYCRERGIYVDDITQWKARCLTGFSSVKSDKKQKESKKDRQILSENKKLKKELRLKDKALAETMALLVLRKKLNALYGVEEDD